MTLWSNHVTLAVPQNTLATHTGITPSAGTVVDGALFTPTAGRLLVCSMAGSVTSGSSTGDPTPAPTGWTGPTGNQAINNIGLYVWWKTAAGSDTLTAVHNASNYPVVADWYEYPAGSTFSGTAAAFNVASTVANPILSGLTGTNLIFYVAGNAVSATTGTNTYSWAAGVVKENDTLVLRGGSPATDGYAYTSAYIEDSVATSSPSQALTYGSVPPLLASGERLTYAVKIAVSAVAVPPSLVTCPPVRRI